MEYIGHGACGLRWSSHAAIAASLSSAASLFRATGSVISLSRLWRIARIIRLGTLDAFGMGLSWCLGQRADVVDGGDDELGVAGDRAGDEVIDSGVDIPPVPDVPRSRCRRLRERPQLSRESGGGWGWDGAGGVNALVVADHVREGQVIIGRLGGTGGGFEGAVEGGEDAGSV